MGPLKISIISNSQKLDKYTFNILKWIKENENKFQLDHIIIVNNQDYYLRNFKPAKILKKIFFRIILSIEKILLNFYNLHKDHLKKFETKNLIKTTININELKKKNRSYFSENDIEKIKEEKFDIIIRACSNILSGEILKLPKYGILSFHHGDIENFRGSPAGFWEVYFKKDDTGFIIQQLNENLDAGKVLYRGFFQTKYFFLLNQAELYFKSNFFFKKILIDIYNKNIKNDFKYQTLGDIYEIPKITKQLKYISELIKKITKKLFFRKTYWNICLINSKDNKTFIPQIKKDFFLADPFIFQKDNKSFCFAEEFNFKNNKGHIVCFEITNSQLLNKREVLNEKFHLSFPYIFEFENNIYMCPETSSIDEIRLYIAKSFPHEWEYHSTIIKNIKSADSVIFEKNNYWWLITNKCYDNSNDFTHDLSIFYSRKGPLTMDWHEHKMNPVLTDSRRARNAGIFFDKNQNIIRVSQKQGYDKYGKSVSFNIIKNISPSEFEEEKVDFDFKKNISFSKNIRGIHHVCKIKDNIIFDFN